MKRLKGIDPCPSSKFHPGQNFSTIRPNYGVGEPKSDYTGRRSVRNSQVVQNVGHIFFLVWYALSFMIALVLGWPKESTKVVSVRQEDSAPWSRNHLVIPGNLPRIQAEMPLRAPNDVIGEMNVGHLLPGASFIGGLLSRCDRSRLLIPFHSRISVVFV